MLLLLLLMAQPYYQNDKNDASTSFHSTLNLNSRRLRQGKMRRLSLHHPELSSFSRFFNSGQDDALVTMCGFDHASFAILHAKFEVEFDKYTPYSNDGRIRKLPQQEDVGTSNKKRG
jgi:hypothetical protein